MDDEKLKIDQLDRKILTELRKNARQPLQEIARWLGVSGGTVHLRVNKMQNAGVIQGAQLVIDHAKLGYDICAFIGVNFHNAADLPKVVEKFRGIPEIIEAHFTTGKYNLFLKILVRDTADLKDFLVDRLQKIPEIQSTETLISLDIPVRHEIPLGRLD